jgi:AbrB family looped-hinge helix DNA binding protein
VIPKALRDEAGLGAGTEIEVMLYDGRIEIEPVPLPARVVERDGAVVIDPGVADLPPLTDADVRAVLERVRR